MNIFKSKIFFGVMCVITILCIWEYFQNVDKQRIADEAMQSLSPSLRAYVNEDYIQGNADRDRAKNTDIIVGGISGIFVVYYIFTNFIKK